MNSTYVDNEITDIKSIDEIVKAFQILDNNLVNHLKDLSHLSLCDAKRMCDVLLDMRNDIQALRGVLDNAKFN